MQRKTTNPNYSYSSSWKKQKNRPRTAQGLRDILFDELDELRSEDADPFKSAVVGRIAETIMKNAKTEIEMQRALSKDESLCEDYQLGELRLGKREIDQIAETPSQDAVSVGASVMGQSCAQTKDTRGRKK